MTIRRAATLIAVATLAVTFAACGSGGSGSTTPPISLSFTPGLTPPSSLTIGSTAGIAVTISNGPQNATVNWTVSCGTAGQCGSFSPTSTGSTDPTTYTAPGSVPAGGSVTITATSANDGTKTISATIAIGTDISVTFQTAPPTSLLIDAAAVNIAANVANDPNNAGVNWTVTCGSAQCGSFSSLSTLNGVATAYTDPTAVPTGNSVTVTATSVTDSGKSASATITITSNITVAFTSPGFLPPPSMNTNAQAQIAAFTTGDPNNAGVVWSVTCGSAGCGSFGQSPTLNNVPTLYTAPLSVPSGNTVSVTATSVSDFNQTVSGTITITQGPATLPDGTYVYQLSGEDNDQQSPFSVAGAFTIQSGEITGGEQDFVDLVNGPGNDGILRDSNTTITPTADGNLQIVLDTGDTNLGVDGNGLETLNVVLVTSTTGLVTWFDGFAAANGTIALQDPATAQALPKYGYAFLTSGADNNALTAPLVIGGIINVDDLNSTTGTISGAGSVIDINDGSAAGPEPDQPLAASTVTGSDGGPAPDQYGRVIFTLTPNANPAIGTIAFAGYIVDSNSIALVETGDGYEGTTGGTALAQGQAKTGTFGTADLSGSSYVVGAQGEDDFFALDFAGALTFNSNGSVSGSADFNDESNPSSGPITGGSYAVDSTGISAGTGRVTITNLTGTNLNFDPSTTAQPATLQLYLDGKGNALMASMDVFDFTAGPAFKQTSGASLSGAYALSGAGVSVNTFNNWSAVGPISIDSGGAIGAGSFTDFDYFGSTLPADLCGVAATTCADVPITGTTGTITGLGADSIAAGPPLVSDTFDFYIIDGLRAFGIETDPAQEFQTGLLYLQQAPAAVGIKARR